MSKMDVATPPPQILLIQLYGVMQPPSSEPLSIEVLGRAILDNINNVEVIFEKASSRKTPLDLERILKIVTQKSPVVIGISIPQSTLLLAFELINEIYHLQPYIKIVLGHSLPTYSFETFLDVFPNIIIVRGWGEDAFVDLAKFYLSGSPSIDTIPNLCYLQNNEIQLTPIRWPKKIPHPIRLDSSAYYSRVESSRGCHHDVCTFCTRPPINKDIDLTWNRRNISDVLLDIQELKDKGIHFFTFTDEDFVGSDLNGACKIADGIKSIGGLQFSLSLRADHVFNPFGSVTENELRKRLISKLRDAGLYLIFIGVESLSNSQLKRYGKGTLAEDNIRSLQLIQQTGIEMEIGFILFDPLLTKIELQENIDRLDRYGLWVHVGQLINNLRPQKGAVYTHMLVKSELTGKYNPDIMSYEFSFADPIIAEIMHLCRNWLEEFDPIYILARHIQRTTDASGVYTRFLFHTRSILFRLLRLSIEARIYQNSQLTDDLLGPFNAEREGLIRHLLSYLQSFSHFDETETSLMHECQKFLN
jgi:hypothetical protein